MNLKQCTHQELCDVLVGLIATKDVSNADLQAISDLAQDRTFTRSQKEAISRLCSKYGYTHVFKRSNDPRPSA